MVEDALREGVQVEGWPSRRFGRWPVRVDWEGQDPRQRVWPTNYQKAVGVVRLLFLEPAYAGVLESLQDYCFQQGAVNNANARDRAMFFSVLAHDLLFFRGDRGRLLLDDLPIDAKSYQALPHMEASTMSLWRVVERRWWGGIVLEDVLRGGRFRAQTRLLRAPAVGEVLVGRLLSVGVGLRLVEPWLAVAPAQVGALEAAVTREYAVAQRQHQGLTWASFLKVAGYHLYEYAAGLNLIDAMAQVLPGGVRFCPRLVTFKLRHAKEAPDLSALADATVVERDGAGRAVLVQFALAEGCPPTVGEAIVSVEGKRLELLSFIDKGVAEVSAALAAQMPPTVLRAEEKLEPLAIYRALRHGVSIS